MTSRLLSFFSVFALSVLLISCKQPGTTPDPDVFQLLKVSADDITLSTNTAKQGISPEATITVYFSSAVDSTTVMEAITLINSVTGEHLPLEFSYSGEVKNIVISVDGGLEYITDYTLSVSEALRSEQGAEFPGVSFNFTTMNGIMEIISATINGVDLTSSVDITNIKYDSMIVEVVFSEALNTNDYQDHFTIGAADHPTFSLLDEGTKVVAEISEPLDYYRFYSVNVSGNLTAANGFTFSGFSKAFQTGLNPGYKFPEITDEELLTTVQEATFNYFWDFGHPVSGLARERNSSGDVVTIGGSGFGLMSILVGIERGFITRQQGVERLEKIINFLNEDADRFHGVWSHWLNGSSGDAIAFSTKDNGADLVETAFMAQGLIAVRQYLNEVDLAESLLITTINEMLDEIEWDWFTKNGEDVLYWHWSPTYDWDMNMQIRGYNEALIVYVLAASSENFGIDPDVYHNGWARSGAIGNGNTFYGYELPVGYDRGGPLFFAHYSFLGLDPRNLSDTYADYWTQNRNHTLINRAYCVENPKNYVGYNEGSWGLTASDEPNGYSAHEPTYARDNGTITPTAALSSIPYTPEESMEALRHFYYVLGDKLWGEYGFYDAYNPSQGWWANSYLAIDQGPIVVMIENYRTGLIWDLFMSAPEVQSALDTLGFTYSD